MDLTIKIKNYISQSKELILIGFNSSLAFLLKLGKKRAVKLLPLVVAALLAPILFIFLLFVIQDKLLYVIPPVKTTYQAEIETLLEKQKQKTVNQIIYLQQRLNAKTPGSTYLIINSSTNEFKLFSGLKEIRRGICSTGSYVQLETDNQKWLFKTPKGVLRVQGKTENPVWIKPDWAFIEEGLPVPPKGHYSRYEYGTLGDYALSLGNGYLIHGTLYKRFLGMPVTHGCVRMNDEDLEKIYQTLRIGSKVYIY